MNRDWTREEEMIKMDQERNGENNRKGEKLIRPNQKYCNSLRVFYLASFVVTFLIMFDQYCHLISIFLFTRPFHLCCRRWNLFIFHFPLSHLIQVSTSKMLCLDLIKEYMESARERERAGERAEERELERESKRERESWERERAEERELERD